jgi:hypothetical protein
MRKKRIVSSKHEPKLNLPREGGVYRIRNVTTNDAYIGATRNIRQRCMYQRSNLRRGLHHAPKLQDAFDMKGSEFTYEALLLCALEHLSFYEDRAIRLLNSNYNTKPSSPRPVWLKSTSA